MNRQRAIKGDDWTGHEYQYGTVLSEHSVGYWNTQCKLCDKVHVLETRSLRVGARSKKCDQYRAPNWSGLEREDAIMRRQYGITLAEYNAMLEKQDYKCAICGNEDEVEGRRLAIDHCHTKGNVRGLLCGKCNRGLGLFYDNLDLLEKAKDYLIKYANAR
jgi:hypothetical protein